MPSLRIAARHRVTTGIVIALLAVSTGLCQAEQILKSPKKGVEVQLKSDVQAATAKAGDPFEAELKDSVRYKNWTLPAGTTFKGQMTKIQPSRRWGRPGYVVMETQQAVLPDGRTFEFDANRYKARNYKLHHPDTNTFPQMVATQLPYTAVSMAVTLPLYYAGGVSPQPLFVIGEGIRILTGSVVGLFRPRYKNEPVPRKIALGGLDGSGIPRAVGFVSIYPQPDYHAGDTVKLYFNPNGLNDLFHSTTGNISLQTHADMDQTAISAP